MQQHLKNFLFVGIGGSIGAMMRYSVTLLTGVNEGFPVDTLLVNLLGCFCLSYFLRRNSWLRILPKELSTALGVGVIGSFTTFSTIAVGTVELATASLIYAFIYVSIHLFAGLLCCLAGYQLAKKSEVRA